jgi:hypothetical protein
MSEPTPMELLADQIDEAIALKDAGEADMLTLLRQRCAVQPGNGPRWVFMPHVRSDAGFDARRTLDAVAMDMWPSKGLRLHGFEIKCSRSDWLRELKSPEKAQMFHDRVDQFWLVVSDRSIVRDGELPADWGLMAPIVDRWGARRLHVYKSAPVLPATDERRAVQRNWLACLLRAATSSGGEA